MRLCGSLWGGAQLHTAPLRSVTVEDAVYIPFSEAPFFDRDPAWGIYTRDGTLVPQAAYVRGEDGTLVGQSARRDLVGLELDEAPFDEMTYGGPIVPHYGHFIIASLSRLWACGGGRPAVFHSWPAIFDHRMTFIRELVAAAGFEPGTCMSFARPTRIKRLHVPESAFIEQARTTPAYRRSMVQVGDRFPTSSRFDRAYCYLSKTGLTDGVVGFGGEEAVEDAFSRAGFEIIQPEKLSIAEQVDLFRSSSLIAGTTSSGFHTVALAPRTRSLRVAFSFQDILNSNFSLIDLGVDGRSFYFSLRDEVEATSRPNFLSYYQARNPERLAGEMVSMVLTLAAFAR